MHKQRSKRVGKSPEARRKHYERMMERILGGVRVDGPGKAFAGSRKNKKVKKQGGATYSVRKDWKDMSMTHDEYAEYMRDTERREALEHFAAHDHNVIFDASAGRKPNHAARAINIVDAFTLPHHKADEQAKSMLEKLKEKLVRR